ETRLKDLSQIVLGGRRELMRLQGKDTTALAGGSTAPASPQVDASSYGGVDGAGNVRARAKQAANRLRKAAGGRLAS
ncbi:MAG: hypothetical protein ACKOYK_11010, partial [Cyanobium sp.]